MINLSFYSRLRILECEDCICFFNKKLLHDKLQFLSLFNAIYTCSKDCINCFFYKKLDERQWLSAGYAWHSRPRTTTLSSNLRNGGDESG